MFKFIHAADVHLDSPLAGLDRYEGAPVERVRDASRRSLERLVNLAIEEKVAFVLLCGDLFDGDWKDTRTGLFLAKEIGRLRRAGIDVFIVLGNHDSQNPFAKKAEVFPGARVFSSRRAETIRLDDWNVALHGRSFPARQVGEDLSRDYPDPLPGAFNIGLLHTSLNGRPGHDPYAPCSIEGLASKGYQYWALGHVHQYEVVRAGDPWVVFPGCLQGRHARETGPKGCVLVTVEDGEVVWVEHREVCTVRWEEVRVDATGADGTDEVTDRIRRAVAAWADAVPDALIAMRIRVTGACRAHLALAGSMSQWISDVREQVMAACGDGVFVEKVQVETRPEASPDEALARDDALGTLLRVIQEQDFDDSQLRELAQTLQELRDRLPREALEGEEAVSLEDPAYLRAAVAQARDLILARLLAAGGDS